LSFVKIVLSDIYLFLRDVNEFLSIISIFLDRFGRTSPQKTSTYFRYIIVNITEIKAELAERVKIILPQFLHASSNFKNLVYTTSMIIYWVKVRFLKIGGVKATIYIDD
jgi:hypothetical protein